MGLVQRLSQDLKAGWTRVRYGTAQAANRALEETELLRLRLQHRRVQERLRDVYRDLGERAMVLHERGEPVERMWLDPELRRLLEQAESAKAESTKLETEMEDVRLGR